ncbi:hypothetical protein [Bradyrhizobium lablabi]|uniref:hypothetical protein n=1 Tax=Bradyrhizobium lablabi TaxID=722472 RepID=UPI000B0ED8CE|nr:hypothetical protein [Bradyrhizobium lablabi]
MKPLPHRQLAVPAATALFVAAFGLILPANAQTFSSSYTSTAPKDCRTIGKPGAQDDSTQVCPGQSGLVVVISEGDLRQTVSVGRTREAAAKEPAAESGFGPFNSTANTVEWRAVDGKPFAIIQRWLIADIDNPDKKTGNPTSKPMLAVTRLPPGPVCHVAYIDGQANRNANELARQAADEFARDFKCGKDEVKVIGEKGAAVGLAKR